MKAELVICDNYACNPVGKIREDRYGLDGAWRDSGVNALSALSVLIPLSNCKIISREEQIDPSRVQCCYVLQKLQIEDIHVSITVDWRKDTCDKYSVFWCENGIVNILHTKQQVFFNNHLIFEGSGINRLDSHYLNFFRGFIPDKQSLEVTHMIHKILFDGEQILQ